MTLLTLWIIAADLAGELPSGGTAAAVELPPWAGPVFTLAGLIGGWVIAVVLKVLRGPVEVKDLWTENRALRAELGSLRADHTGRIDAVNAKVDKLLRERQTQRTYNRAFADGFDAQSRLIERMVDETGVRPKYGPGEHEAIERARALPRVDVELDDDDDLTPEQNGILTT